MSTVSTVDDHIKRDDAASYDPLAATFDRFTTYSATPLAAQMLTLAGVAGSQRVLDVGTGTGLVALQAASRIGTHGEVLGIDLSEGMLEVARAKAAQAGFATQLKFRRMDAEELGLEDQSFDVVVSLFALFHFPNPLRALQEMYRVLRPRGTLVLGVGSGPPLLSWVGLVHRILCLPKMALALQGRRLTAPGFLNGLVEKHFPCPCPTELPEWVTKTRDKKRYVRDLTREAGFRNLNEHWTGHQVFFDNPEQFWDLQVTFSSTARKRLARVPQEKVAVLRREFLQACAKVLSRGGELAYPCGAFYIVGNRR
jgi:ubiquinone/menaquinone biosynthesis C-methylase UbiE